MSVLSICGGGEEEEVGTERESHLLQAHLFFLNTKLKTRHRVAKIMPALASTTKTSVTGRAIDASTLSVTPS